MKERLDVLLVQKGLAPSREKAKTMIMEGNVFVDNQREDKAGTFFDPSVNIEIPALCQPWRTETGKGNGTVWHYPR